jgi:hypothetical protein
MVADMLFELANLLFFQAARANPHALSSSLLARAARPRAPSPAKDETLGPRLAPASLLQPFPRGFISLSSRASDTALASCLGWEPIVLI